MNFVWTLVSKIPRWQLLEFWGSVTPVENPWVVILGVLYKRLFLQTNSAQDSSLSSQESKGVEKGTISEYFKAFLKLIWTIQNSDGEIETVKFINWNAGNEKILWIIFDRRWQILLIGLSLSRFNKAKGKKICELKERSIKIGQIEIQRGRRVEKLENPRAVR